ncbi:uncharacterized protein LOC132722840 [Ruditapes philippinarum]|uniref:uncharacterized protein LOC132722840 n=1 Tax=Ruditapes philippinarum TaxID=129788 RepID=UPI00295ADF6B|nr:uncharacterized protein LOC132722840 [Ruditapes philippinarum]
MKGIPLQLFIILSFLNLRSEAGSCYRYVQRSKEVCTGWWSRTCRTKYHSERICCSHYNGALCSNPKCRYGYGANTCNKNFEGYVKYKNGNVVRNSGGECYAPFRCRNCNKGYYPVTTYDGYCKACYKPTKCNLPVCTSWSNYWCEYCEEEYIRLKPGYNVYSGLPDNKKCQRTCSWKPGARCFPGSCTGNMILENDCQCARGFSSKYSDCSTATSEKKPTIKQLYFKLHGPLNSIKIVDKALNTTIFWTKDVMWSIISFEASSNYVPEIDSSKKPNYITGYHIGIAELKIHLTLSRGSDYGEWTIDGGCSNFDENCDKTITDKVISSISSWRKIMYNGNFEHGDKIKFKVSAKNGGKVEYEYRSTFTFPYRKYQYYLNGITASKELELRFDTFPPTHCFEQDDNCLQDPLQVKDFLTESKFTAYWAGWTDLDSGIDEYEFNIYYLENSLDDNLLRYKYMLTPTRLSSSQSSATLHLEEPGPYSVEIIVHDRAKNYKVARRIILYDNASVVDLYGKQASIVQADESGWINKNSEQIEIEWPNRFRNIRHSNGGWLNGVQENGDIIKDLDDREGRSSRTVDRLNNVNGIVRFDIARNVEFDGKSNYSGFERVPEEVFKLKKMVYTDEEFVDGMKLTYIIRGTDAVGEFAEDNVTAMIDLSPPIIQNVWLSKGYWGNAKAYSIFGLYELLIDWKAFDYHSGIHKLSWKIFENITNTEITFGEFNEPPIGETKTIEECKITDTVHTRGINCYCSPYNGCYHKHFQVKPLISEENKNGLIGGWKSGDFEYLLEVTATNNAGLTTTKQAKVKL